MRLLIFFWGGGISNRVNACTTYLKSLITTFIGHRTENYKLIIGKSYKAAKFNSIKTLSFRKNK